MNQETFNYIAKEMLSVSNDEFYTEMDLIQLAIKHKLVFVSSYQ